MLSLTTPPSLTEVNDLLARAERAAALISGAHDEVMRAYVRGVLAVASVQLQYAAAGERQAGENARHLLSTLRIELESTQRYPDLVVPAALHAHLLDLGLAGRAFSGR